MTFRRKDLEEMVGWRLEERENVENVAASASDRYGMIWPGP